MSDTVVAAVTPFAGAFTWRNDAARSGQNLQEFALTPGTLNSASFGKLFSCPVDGYVYAQPLYVANVAFPNSTFHNVVYAATEHDSVYAFDADSPSCSQLWKSSLLGAGESTVSPMDVGSQTIVPEIGITGTPVIDPQSKTLYVVAKSKDITTLNPTFIQRLHALDLVTGQERGGSPVVIQASVAGTGDGTDGFGNVAFAPLPENQRAALLLSAGVVYVAFASHGDVDPYHGWVLGYDAATLAPRSVFNTTPNGGRGGIWQSGGGPSADASGNIFVVTGNGTFDASPCLAGFSCADYGDTFLKLSTSSGLSVADFFTPFNQALLSLDDLDVGATSALLLPDQPGTHPHLLLGGSKAGLLYLLDRDNLGQFNSSGNQIVQSIDLGTDGSCGICGTPAYWQGLNAVYVVRSGDFLRAFQLSNGLLPSAATSVGSTQFGFPGAAPTISSNGSADGIVWALDNSGFATSQPAILHAYDATNVANELYNSSQAANGRDAAGPAVKFTVPTIANGKVYVGGQGQLTIYGLLP